LILFGLVRLAVAHNGAVAIAVPVERITIDGDLSDWPEYAPRYPIRYWHWRQPPSGAADFNGWVRFGYQAQEQALYIAVKIEDESVMLTYQGGWDTQDGMALLIDKLHEEEMVKPLFYWLNGDKQSVFGRRPVAGIAVKVQQTESGYQHEWRVSMGQGTDDSIQLQPGRILGVYFVFVDQDTDGSFTNMEWGLGGMKSQFSDMLGDVLLVGNQGTLGTISGQLQWAESKQGVARGKIRVQGLSDEGRGLQVMADDQGKYEVLVPAGQYRVAPLAD
jgi:hypothetical protein